MSKKPKYLELEEEILGLKLQQSNILVKEAKKIVTGLKNHLKRMDASEKQFPGLKEKNKSMVLEARSALEQMELKLETELSERERIELQIQWLKKPKRVK